MIGRPEKHALPPRLKSSGLSNLHAPRAPHLGKYDRQRSSRSFGGYRLALDGLRKRERAFAHAARFARYAHSETAFADFHFHLAAIRVAERNPHLVPVAVVEHDCVLGSAGGANHPPAFDEQIVEKLVEGALKIVGLEEFRHSVSNSGCNSNAHTASGSSLAAAVRSSDGDRALPARLRGMPQSSYRLARAHLQQNHSRNRLLGRLIARAPVYRRTGAQVRRGNYPAARRSAACARDAH